MLYLIGLVGNLHNRSTLNQQQMLRLVRMHDAMGGQSFGLHSQVTTRRTALEAATQSYGKATA